MDVIVAYVVNTLRGTRGLEADLDIGTWHDLLPVTASVGTGASALTVKEISPGEALYKHWDRGTSDKAYYSFQNPHDLLPGTQFRPHAHSIPVTNVAGAATDVIGNVYWEYRYAWSGIGLEMPKVWTQVFVTEVITVGDQWREVISGPLITAPAGLPVSAHLHVAVSRRSDLPQDTFKAGAQYGLVTANLALVSVDCHAKLRRTGGTITEFA